MKKHFIAAILTLGFCAVRLLMAETYTEELYDYNSGKYRTITWTYTVGRESYGGWDYGEVSITAVSGATGDVSIPTIEVDNGSWWDEYGGYHEEKKRYNVTQVASKAFSGCAKMTSISIPSSVNSIYYDAFEGCSSLTSFREGDDSYSSYYKVRNGLLYYYDELVLVPSGLTDVRIPEGTTSIYYDAFYCCRKLKSVSIPRSLQYIESYSFYSSALPSAVYFEPGDGMRVKKLFRDASYNLSDSVFVQKKGAYNGVYRELYPLQGDGTYDWVIDNAVFYQNGVSLRSPTIDHSTSTYVTFTVENVASLSWWWKVSSESGFDLLSCYIDEMSQASISGEQDWQAMTIYPGTGTHTIKIEYSKDGSATSGSDCGWIDGLIVTNSASSTIEAPWTSEQRENGHLWITGTTNTTGAVLIPSVLDGQAVAGIGDWLFECCSGLTSVTIPEGITDIGTGAFSGCTALRTIDIPATVCNIGSNMFYGCSNLTNINVAAQNQSYGVHEGSLFTKDGEELLFVPRGVTTITIPSSVMRISTNALSEASSSTTLNVEIGDEERVKGLVAASGASDDSFTFKECAMVAFDPNGGTCAAQPLLVVIGEYENLPFPTRNGYMFAGWFTARNGGTEMRFAPVSAFNASGETTFYAHWEPITWLYVSNSGGTLTVTGCCPTAYGNLIIPASIDGQAVAGIGDRAFYGRTGLTGVTISSSGIISIGSEAFGGCSSLQEINLPENVEFTGTSPFAGTAYLNGLPDGFLVFGKFLLGYKGSCPSSITVPEGVESVCDSAFSGKSISSVTFPSSLRRIGKNAFYNCRMARLTFPEGLQVIDDSAFENINSLSTVNFPRTLKRIGMYAFAKNNGYGTSYVYPIQHVDIEAENLYVGYRAFACDGDFSPYDYIIASISLRGSGIVVGDYAFSGYKHGYGVTIDLSGVSKVGNYAFSRVGYYQASRYSDDGFYAPGCVTVTISDELQEASTNAFRGAAVGTICVENVETVFSRSGWLSMFSECAGTAYEGYYCRLKVGDSYVSDLQIPDGCTSVPPYALCGIKLASISVPASVTNIGEGAFASCFAALQFEGAPPLCNGTPFRYCYSGGYASHQDEWLTAIQDGEWQGLLMSYGDVLDYADALDIPTLSLTNTGWYVNWFVQSKDVHYGTRALMTRSGIRGEVALECEISGPADLSYWWKIGRVKSGYNQNSMSLYIDGAVVTNINDDSTWVQVSRSLSSGVHNVKWQYYGVESYRNYANEYGLLDDVKILYEVRFDLGAFGSRTGGGALTQKVRHGASAVEPIVNAVNGYVFTGWNGSIDRVTGATTFVAQYRELTIREVFNDASFELVNDTTYPWTPIKDTSAGGLASVRSGTISHSQRSALTLKVQGAGQISFKWKVSSESGCDKLSVTGDGSSLATAISGETSWATVTKTFNSAGEHTVVWTYSKDSSVSYGSDCGWVTDVTWTPYHVVTFAANGGSVSPSSQTVAGDEAVGSLPTPTRAGYDFLGWYTEQTDGSRVTTSTVVTADVTYYAHWQIKTYQVTFDLGGHGTRTGGGSLAQTVTYQSAAVAPDVEAATGWVFTGWDASFTSVTGAMTIRALYERAPLTIAEAAGGDLAFTTGGAAEWFAEWSESAHDGRHHLRSGAIGNKQTSDLSAVVQGDGTVSFWCKVSSEADEDEVYDGLSFYVDGVQLTSNLIGGETGWTNLTFEISGAGSHTLCWRYSKDKSDSAGSDCAWLDEVTWTPEAIIVDPLPEVASDSDVTNALAGAADETRLRAHLSDKAKYDQFRTWMNAKGLDHQTVKSSARAWFSYAIGANGLVERDFRNEDVTIGSPTPTSDGGLSFKVDVRGASIGAGATPANLESVFRVQGAYSLRENAFSSKNVVSEISASANGSIAVNVTPKHATGAFFVRMCLYADGEPGPEPDEELPPSCTVTFDANGGVGGTTVSVFQRNALGTLPTPTFEGREFQGWFTAVSGGTQVTDSTIIMADVTYYAHWTRAKVQLWEGGPYWATMNIGAEKPEDYGYYFWWGDTVGYTRENNAWVANDGSSSNFSFHWDNTPNFGKNKATLQSEGWITVDGVLAPEHDAAHVQWGGDWRMPTEQELADLNSNCDWTWTTQKGVSGYVVRGRGDYATSSIFLPAAGYGLGTAFECAAAGGYYWFSVPNCELYFNIVEHRKNVIDFDYGFTVRPVQGGTE